MKNTWLLLLFWSGQFPAARSVQQRAMVAGSMGRGGGAPSSHAAARCVAMKKESPDCPSPQQSSWIESDLSSSCQINPQVPLPGAVWTTRHAVLPGAAALELLGSSQGEKSVTVALSSPVQGCGRRRTVR